MLDNILKCLLVKLFDCDRNTLGTFSVSLLTFWMDSNLDKTWILYNKWTCKTYLLRTCQIIKWKTKCTKNKIETYPMITSVTNCTLMKWDQTISWLTMIQNFINLKFEESLRLNSPNIPKNSKTFLRTGGNLKAAKFMVYLSLVITMFFIFPKRFQKTSRDFSVFVTVMC